MKNTDTIKLLQECDSGTKMAVISIDEVLKDVKDPKLEEILRKSRNHHEELGNEIHSMLNEEMADEKNPNPMARGMSWMKTNMKLSMEDSDATIADLMTDGCNMGIKSLYRYLNQYENAEESAKEITEKLVDIEEELRRDMKEYL